MKNKESDITSSESMGSCDMESLCSNSVDLIQYARGIAARQINLIQLMTFFTLGKWIIEKQQQGDTRAKYGSQIIANLSAVLTATFGKGFSPDNLENARKFFLTYNDRISETVFRKFAIEKSETVSGLLEKEKPFTLPWSHIIFSSCVSKTKMSVGFMKSKQQKAPGASERCKGSITPAYMNVLR